MMEIIKKIVIRLLILYLIISSVIGTTIIIQLINGKFYEINCKED